MGVAPSTKLVRPNARSNQQPSLVSNKVRTVSSQVQPATRYSQKVGIVNKPVLSVG